VATINSNPNFQSFKNLPRKGVSGQIDGTRIPATLAAALADGFEVSGHDTTTKLVQGNQEISKGKAHFEQGGLSWLECRIDRSTLHLWDRLQTNLRDSQIPASLERALASGFVFGGDDDAIVAVHRNTEAMEGETTLTHGTDWIKYPTKSTVLYHLDTLRATMKTSILEV
jgi:hypothetical protein